MNTLAIDQTIEQLTGEIALRQNAITALHQLKTNGDAPLPAEPPKGGTTNGKRKFKPRRANHPQLETRKAGGAHGVTRPTVETGGATSVVDKLDKPDSIGGAMKFIIRQNPNGQFNADTLKEAMAADVDFAKLLKEHADKAPSQHPIMGNLNYWTKQEKIRAAGNGFVVNREHAAFFGIEA